MLIRKRTLWAAACICLMCGSPLFAVTITVSNTLPAAFTTIQRAIDLSTAGDTVKILDASTYKEQVTINGLHSGITLTSANPTSPNKPTIQYPDQGNEGPKTCAQAQVDSLITFDQNGALRLMRVHNVVINGITVDGGGVMPFGSTEAVWPAFGGSKISCQYPLLHGNTAIVLWIAGDIIIRNCEAKNAFFGIYLKDRNEGGIFANANPGDNAPWNVVPLSNFAQTGNHIIEYTRVHDNSWGIFIESAWDLGSTIRYNLIYENHHPNATLAAQVKALNSEGQNQPGGAMFFKDDMLCPLSIYNNTFWHNYLIFCGGWQVGYQHLVFNNIFAKPFMYWTLVPSFSSDAYMEITSMLPNRITNCVYSCQAQAPQTSYVSIMNGLPQVQGVNNQPPAQGSLLQVAAANQAFPASANNRWLEMDTAFFISVNPASPNFLEPNWNDTLVQTYIKNKGWQKSGVKNLDGLWADLGAIHSAGGTPANEATIRPIMPVTLSALTAGSTATVIFSLTESVGKMLNPTIKFFRWVSNLYYSVNSWSSGAAASLITAANINDIAVPAAPPVVGANTYTVTIPVAQTTPYAFFEAIIEGAGADGKLYTTSTGFLPYRKLDYHFLVQVFNLTDISYLKPLTQVTAGDTVILRITPLNANNSPFANRVDSVKIRLQSGFKLRIPPFGPSDTAIIYPNGVTGATNKIVMFTGVPNSVFEYVYANGEWISTTDTTQRKPFPGVSDAIRVLAGPPATVVFQDPPSKRFGIPPPKLNPGQPYTGNLFVYDIFNNKANTSASITLSSLTPAVASFVNGTITTDSTGTGYFSVNATSTATENTPVTLQALLSATGSHDTAYMTVGPRLEHLFIFYSDTSQYNSATRLEGQVGDRLPVTIIATKSANPTIDSIATARNDTFTVSGNAGLEFYNSAGVQPAYFVLVNGRATVWVTNSVGIDSISNGCMSATAATAAIGNSNQRCNIYFHRPLVAIDSAFYYSRTGFGMVDSVDIYYKAKLTMIPDSITLFWPGSDTGKRVVLSSQMALAADSMHITIVLASPFAPLTTAATTTSRQGISYNRPNTSASESASSFAIKERVGPLIMTAQVVERIPAGAGTDTLYVSFSEPLDTNSLAANPLLLLIHNGGSSALNVVSRSILGGNWVKFVVSSATSGPVAGDSLRIQPGGRLADALGNYAHPLNRPVVVTLKPIPPAIVQAWYLDKNADGIVDAVDIKFTKSVFLPDVVASLTWGVVSAAYADSIQLSRLRYPGADSLTIEIKPSGAFKSISADSIKTSGPMTVSVGFKSMPDALDEAGVADSAAPVIVSANYFPGPVENGSGSSIDTLSVNFSEPIAAITSSTPFQLYSNKSSKPYTFSLNVPSLPGSGTALRFIVTQIQGVVFPQTGDSMWIDPTAGVGDAASAIQKNPGNRRVALQVAPIPYKAPPVTIVKNPFSIGSPVSDAGVSGTGTIIEVTPLKQLAGLISFTATGSIYDALGNTVAREVAFKQNFSAGSLYYNWDGRNLNSRYVGTGTYVAIITVTDSNGKVFTKKLTVGVKR